ncbi:MAG: NAD(P)H-binding protein [Acidobacteria bacterium]|nr:NAD(P)H-binding protein [Acidobacteriota bacterium]
MTVFLTGGTGYLGRALIPRLLERGHHVRALVRPGSESKLPPRCEIVPGNPLEPYAAAADTFLHLIGVSKPAPWKADQFRAVDLASVRAAVTAASAARVSHFIYVSVAHPAPVMRAYIQIRTECESLITAAGLNCTILRPWYVLGPHHRWPYLLLPFYRLFEILPFTRETALRLGLVTLAQMISALVWAVENPSSGPRFLEVPQIRAVRSL